MNFKQKTTKEFLDKISSNGTISRDDVAEFENSIGETVISDNYNMKTLTTESSSNGYKEVYGIAKGFYDEINGGDVEFNNMNYVTLLGRTRTNIHRLICFLRNTREVLTKENIDKYLNGDSPWVLKDDIPVEVLKTEARYFFITYSSDILLNVMGISKDDIHSSQDRAIRSTGGYENFSNISTMFEILLTKNYDMLDPYTWGATPPSGVEVKVKDILELLEDKDKIIESLEDIKNRLNDCISNPGNHMSFSNTDGAKTIFRRYTKFNLLMEEDNLFKTMNHYFTYCNRLK